MRLGEHSPEQVRTILAETGLILHTGPFITKISSASPELADGLSLLYSEAQMAEQAEFIDFHIRIDSPKSIRRWFSPQIYFYFDGFKPFNPFPVEQALPLFEWCLNWSISQHAHQYLIIHAAVIEKGGRAVIMPAPPGSGKSTLCAGLVNRGWRLLSDELTLLSLQDGSAVPLARPVGLKNNSIDVIRSFAPEATISAVTRDTHKGAVAMMKPPAESVRRIGERATPAWVIFPRYVADSDAELVPHSKAEACLELGENAFNYSIHGAEGFQLLTGLLDNCDCYDFSYSRLSDAVEIFSELESSRG
ncbi:MAG: HprK-related kinase A [Sedimenticola sp.]